MSVLRIPCPKCHKSLQLPDRRLLGRRGKGDELREAVAIEVRGGHRRPCCVGLEAGRRHGENRDAGEGCEEDFMIRFHGSSLQVVDGNRDTSPLRMCNKLTFLNSGECFDQGRRDRWVLKRTVPSEKILIKDLNKSFKALSLDRLSSLNA